MKYTVPSEVHSQTAPSSSTSARLGPPSSGATRNARWATNATSRPSGDSATSIAPSVPRMGVASRSAQRRSHNCVPPPDASGPTYTNAEPSAMNSIVDGRRAGNCPSSNGDENRASGAGGSGLSSDHPSVTANAAAKAMANPVHGPAAALAPSVTSSPYRKCSSSSALAKC